MATAESRQTFENHVAKVPRAYGIGAMFALVATLYAVGRALAAPSMDSVAALLAVFGLDVAIVYARSSAQRVQDRLIRLEMQVRLRGLLPPDLQSRIGELTLNQLIALRFAGDAELPALTRKVLDERIADRTAIKKLVTDWQADDFRV